MAFTLPNVPREKWVFGGTVVILLLLGYSLSGSIVEEKTDRITPKKIALDEPVARDPWLVPPSADVYRAGARDPFREPREIEDLAPLDLATPPPPDLALIAPPPWTDLEPKALAFLRRPFEVKESAPPADTADDSPDESGESNEAGAAPPEPPPDNGSLEEREATSAPAVPVARAAVERPRPVEERYDSVTLKGGKTLRGRIQVADPLEVLGDEIDAREDRFSPKAGVRFKMVVHDAETGKSMGSAEYEAAQIDSIQPARTVETRARLQTRRFTPSDVRGRVALGRYCLERGALEPARTAFESAMAIDPANAEAVLGLGAAHRAAFEWDAELALYAKTVAAGAGGAAVRAKKAEIESLFGLDLEAAATRREGLAQSPGDAFLSLELGAVLAKDPSSRDEALALLKRAADGAGSSTDRARALEAAAEVHLRRGELNEAKARVGKARESAADRGTGAALAGAVAFLEGDDAAARREFDAAAAGADLEPGVAAYGSALAEAFDAAASSDAVDARLSAAADAWPLRAAYPLSARAYVALREGRLDAAQEFLEAAIEADPGFAYPRYVLGRLYAHAGDSEKAEASLRAALESEPEFTDALGELSLVALARDDTEAGIRFARRALELEPDRTDIRTGLALHLLKSRATDAAREELEAVVSTAAEEGDKAPARNALAALTYRDGSSTDRLKALDYFQQVIEAGTGGGRVRPADLAYARDNLAAIRDNVSKEQWADGFNRSDLRRDWEDVARFGVDVKLEDGALRFSGRQTQEDKVTLVHREADHGRLVSFEVTLDVPKGTNARTGIVIANFRQDEIYAGLECGRDPKGAVVVRTTRAGKPGEWTPIEGAAWPDDGSAVLSLELADLKQGIYVLKLDGAVVAPEIKVESLRGYAQKVRIGIFGAARIGAEYSFSADDVRIVQRKE